MSVNITYPCDHCLHCCKNNSKAYSTQQKKKRVPENHVFAIAKTEYKSNLQNKKEYKTKLQRHKCIGKLTLSRRDEPMVPCDWKLQGGFFG